jgi:hopene-associated glycosyltransferase HpnB
MLLIAVAALCFAVWVYLAAGRGFFWIIREEPPLVGTPRRRRVVAVVPARNECDTIADAVHSLLSQDYEIDVVVVDDHSEDGTAHLARAAAIDSGGRSRFHLIHAADLPGGWTGKLWAISEGLNFVATMHPDYVLLTDADIRHSRDNVRGLLGRAERDHLDLVSLMVKLRCQSFAEKLLIPAFVFFFFKLYPPRWVAARHKRTAAAAGGCMLVRWTALQRIGGISAIRGELIDDCALARRLKPNGRIWMGVTRATESLRTYPTFGSVWRMISRTAFTELNYSGLQLIGGIAGMFVVYVLPLIVLAKATTAPVAAWLAAGTIMMMITLYAPVLLFYGVPLLWALLLPAVALFYSGATVGSAIHYWRGKGGEWKGRVQAVRRGTSKLGFAKPAARHPLGVDDVDADRLESRRDDLK